MVRTCPSALVVVMVCGLAVGVGPGRAGAQPGPGGGGAEVVSKPMTRPAAGGVGVAKNDELLPIRRITLYRSGVGYFERSGKVNDNAEVQLRFTTEQVNDILKSLVLLDLSGGKVESVSYASKEPLAKRLASFGINIADNPSMRDLLARLRGTPVRLTAADGEASGTVLNVEDRSTVLGGGESRPSTVAQLPWVNLLTEKGVRSFNLTQVTGFEVLDKALAEELNKALATLAEYRADRTKTVDLRFSGAGARNVMVGYVHEMPVWKTSYRLVLPELDSGGQTKGQATLQGWAVVENTTDQDWDGVRLALVSGRPVSFQMDLYEPLFAGRPWVPVPTIPGVAPRIFGLGVDAEQLAAGEARGRSLEAMTSNVMQSQAMARRAEPMAPAAGAPGMPTGGVGGRYGGSSGDADAGGLSAQDYVDYAAKAAAEGRSVGEVFQFEVQSPVSIERQRSAMIPIVTAPITGRRVSIYNAADGSGFPMRGVELTNDAGVALLPGPISVIDGTSYAGDAQIGQTPKGDKRLLAYALDLDCAVNAKPTVQGTVTRVSIVDGAFRQSVRERHTTAYEIANKDEAKGRTIILEHARMPGFELVDTEKPGELTPDLYRFSVVLEAKKARTFTVAQERVRFERVGIADLDLATLAGYAKDGKVSAAVMEAFKTAGQKQAAVAATERSIAETTARIDEIGTDQGRIRNNMQSIDRTSELYRRYVGELTDQENQLKDLRDRKKALQEQLRQGREDLAAFLKGLNVE